MGHYRVRRMVRPRPPGQLTVQQLNEELAEARRRIAQYAAIIAYQENELKRLRDSMCQCCMARYPRQGHEHEHAH